MKVRPSALGPAVFAATLVMAPLLAAANEQTQLADRIVAIVNSEPVTDHEVRQEFARAQQQLALQGRADPDPARLRADVLRQLIDLRIQLQEARDMGIAVDEPSIDQAEKLVARQNGLDVAELYRRLQVEGVDRAQFRSRLREQLTLNRLRERAVEPRVRVTDLDIQQYLAGQQEQGRSEGQLINLAQIFVKVDEQAAPALQAQRKQQAQKLLERLRAGEDFAALAKAHSESPEGAQGGEFGLKPADRYPELFVDATQKLATGQTTGLIRSGAGFHILKVIARQLPGMPPQTVTQTQARHILLVPSAKLSERQAIERLQDYRRRLVSGEADFAALARQHSQDGSASAGGDLGWASPGQFVPEFESIMNRLAPGQVSEPLISRFGVHLIQVLQRRERALTEPEQHAMIRNMLHGKKLQETYERWLDDLRARAYIEIREPLQ